jgi:anti-anti-sigma factor
MEIQETREGAVTVVKPQGPLVAQDADQFRAHLQGVIERSLGRLIVDASSIAFVDSRGLEALVNASDELSSSGLSLKLCGTSDTLREVLELTGLAERFEHFTDVQAGVRSFL